MNKYASYTSLILLTSAIAGIHAKTIKYIRNDSGKEALLIPYEKTASPFSPLLKNWTRPSESYEVADTRKVPVGESHNIDLPDRAFLRISTNDFIELDPKPGVINKLLIAANGTVTVE
ncbi:hypothetical protein H0W26_05630 [Candidatus Dependentiae bacterium]|nr:hypothetical protein [Candidatus Dependentiae bacterium]